MIRAEGQGAWGQQTAQGAEQKDLQPQGDHAEEFPEDGAVGVGREAKGDRGGGLGEGTVNGLGAREDTGGGATE